jgi:hypothetical protein
VLKALRSILFTFFLLKIPESANLVEEDEKQQDKRPRETMG